MGTLAWIAGVLAAFGFVMAGGMKLAGTDMAKQMAAQLGYENLRMLIGAAEVAGGAGVFLGLLDGDWEWLGLLGALGLIATMLGALYYHQQGGHKLKDMVPALAMIGLLVLYLVGITQR